jgi:endonuclease YncB( thermonuclease family)
VVWFNIGRTIFLRMCGEKGRDAPTADDLQPADRVGGMAGIDLDCEPAVVDHGAGDPDSRWGAIEVAYEGQRERVRSIGVNRPETKPPRRGVERYGKAAIEANRCLVEGKLVCLEFDAQPRGKYGRLLAYGYAGQLK